MTETWNPTPESKSQPRGLEMTDIVERLRYWTEEDPIPDPRVWEVAHDAAAEIVRLRALITEWAEAENDDDRAATEVEQIAALDRWTAAIAALREEANR